jgi:hypothetical protein
MSVPISAVMASPRAVEAIQTAERMCPTTTGRPSGTSTDGTSVSLFPPRDADADTRRAWLAASPWPEIVFASAH